MTNNQLTSTHLAVKSELDGYKIHASRGQATAMAMVRLFESIDRDLEELQERRQATMNSEPVAWTWHYREQWHVTNDSRRAEFVAKDGDVAVLPLYRHAQPAPVPAKPVGFINPAREPVLYGEHIGIAIGAQLYAAPQSPGSEPATVPGKWIPVSERMPDDNSDVLCTAEFDGPGDWRRKVGYWHEGKWVVYGASWTPTHWMELPAAPQEVKGE